MELICDRDNCLHEEALVDDQRSREGHSKGNVEKNLDKLDDLSFSWICNSDPPIGHDPG